MDLESARAAALTYSRLLVQTAEQLKAMERRYQLLLGQADLPLQERLVLQEQLKNLQKQIYGKSSEKRNRSSGEELKKKAPRSKTGRRNQPSLPLVEVKHELPDGDRSCSSCGKAMSAWEGQFEESERIHVVPTKFVLEKHLRQKYRCSCGGCIKTAPGPLKLKAGDRYSPEFGVEVGISKYEHHVPLERQVKIMAQAGLAVDSQTLFKPLDTVAWYLKPHVVDKIADRVYASLIANADETPWGNLGKDAKKRFYLWGARISDAVLFEVMDSRSSDAARHLLKKFKGTLMCDGYRGYNPLVDDEGIRLAHCWSHVRRKFVAAEQSYPVAAASMIRLIDDLYDIERELKKAGATPGLVREVRQKRSLPITKVIYQKLWDLKAHLPQSSMGKAVDYTLKLWRGLMLFIEEPALALDNNDMERAIRGPVTGRKNHFGSKSLKTAEVAATWYTVIETCKACGIDPKRYVNEALTAILTGQTPRMPWECALAESATGASSQ